MQSNFIPIILAGGSGSELYPLCEKYPKCLLPLNNQPLIIYQLQQLSQYGYTNALILAGKNATKIDRYLKEYYHGNVKCDVMSLPEDKKETTQAIRYAANKINRDFILIACDTITDVNLDEIVENHILSEAALTAVLKEDKISEETSKVINPSSLAEGHDVILLSSETNSKTNPAILHIQPFQDIKANGLKIKKSILAVHPQATIKTNLVDSHIYVCSYKLLKILDGLDKKISESLESWKEDFLPFLVKNQFNEELISILKGIEKSTGDNQGANQKNGQVSGSNNKAKNLLINAYVAQTEYVRRATNIKDYFQANFDCLKTDKPATDTFASTFQQNEVSLLKLSKDSDAKILSSNIAENTNLGGKVQITKSLVGQNCTIGEGVKISNSIIMKDVVIEQGCVLQNCIVGNKAHIQQNCELKDCWMGLSAFVEANSQLSGEVVVQYEN